MKTVHVFFHRDIHNSSDGTSMFIRKLLLYLSRKSKVDLVAYSDVRRPSVVRGAEYTMHLIPRPRSPLLNRFLASRLVLKKFCDPLFACWPNIYFVSRRIADPDCLICVDCYAGIPVALLGKMQGKKVVLRPNDCIFSVGLQTFSSYSKLEGLLMLMYATVFERLVLKLADAVLAPSRDTASTLERVYGVGEKTYVIPPGSEREPGETHNSIRCEYGFTEEQALIILLATGDNFRNRAAIQFTQETLAPFLEREAPDARIMIVGRKTEEFRDKIKTRNLVIVGEVPATGPYLESADLAIAPMTIVGGVSAKVIEYLCSGLPTVATESSIRTIDQRQGVIVSDLHNFCQDVSTAIRDVQALRSLRNAIRQEALKNYSWDNIGSLTTRIIDSLWSNP